MSKDGLGFGETEAKLQNPGWCGDYRAPQDCLGFFRGPRAWQKARLLKVTLIHVSLRHPYGLHLQDAALNFSQPWLMYWRCLFWHEACPCSAKLLRIEAASRAKIIWWPREQSQLSWLHTMPCLQCCSERMAQGRDTHSNPLLGWNPTPALMVGMSECCWHEININAWKGTSEGCAWVFLVWLHPRIAAG